ncbi:MAG TPA: glycosyltransferase [Clostridia bacterium]|nr:glycosyltransferase [Clostridia bacterium]
MTQKLQIRFFAHSWVSDWNHGNAHFLRGLVRELGRLGHEVRCYEELGAWSLKNLVKQEGEMAIEAIDVFRKTYPELDIRFYKRDETFESFLTEELQDADIVILHEWNDPAVANAVLAKKRQYGFRALFHDTHHRAYTSAGEILRFHLHLFDGVLAFGDAIRRIYKDGFGIPEVWTFHEAADVSVFHPLNAPKTADVVWIGNWGDDERTRELMEFLVQPAAALSNRKFAVHGVRYPEHGLRTLAEAGIEFRGYVPNLLAPLIYGQSVLSLHVPRRQYANGLSGIPTIRVFEALACGVPLACSPWTDAENLFRPGDDYVVVNDGEQMAERIDELLRDDSARRQIAANGLETIRKRHTCAHRAAQLSEIFEELGR